MQVKKEFRSSGGQLYKYNFWYNYSVLVAVRHAGQEGIPFFRRTIV